MSCRGWLRARSRREAQGTCCTRAYCTIHPRQSCWVQIQSNTSSHYFQCEQNAQSSNIKLIKTTTPREKVAKEQLKFGHTFSDHMLEIDWDTTNGWKNPVIRPYGKKKNAENQKRVRRNNRTTRRDLLETNGR